MGTYSRTQNKNKYHPNNLMTMLEGRDEITMDELDDLIDNW